MMRSRTILQNILSNNQVNIHSSHKKFLNDTLDSLHAGAKLTCTSLGRNITSNTTPKHNIKRVNYMLGSISLQQNKIEIYRAIAKTFLAGRTNPRLSIDWSSTNPTKKFHILRATITIKEKGGRGVTIYEEVHPESKLGNDKVQRSFLDKLVDIIPMNCKPIILTDAGFKNNWFKHVINIGWYFIGRIRGTTYYRLKSDQNWEPCRSLYESAKNKPKYVGDIILAKNNPMECSAYLIKEKSKHRKRKAVKGKISKGSESKKNAERNKEPWFLVTNLPGGNEVKYDVIIHYKSRMEIEEVFRDTKSITYGMGLKQHRSTSGDRINILLLIGTIAHIVNLIMGMCIEKEGKQYVLQANTVKTRKVLSYINIGIEYFKRNFCEIPSNLHVEIIKEIAHESL